MYKRYGKRLLDFSTALFMLIALVPILILVAVFVFLTSGQPIFFRQMRPGYHNRIFTLYKFRTMNNVYDEHGMLLSDKARMTAKGALLRRLKLDELPQLWNVVRGEMSLVGPRPLLMQYLGRYTTEQKRRHEVRPGITGLAQVQGGNRLSWEEKFELDNWYVDHLSLILDMKIIFRTGLLILQKLWQRADEAVASEFKGTQPPINH